MFTVNELTAEAIRRAYEDGGEPAGVVELRWQIGAIYLVLSSPSCRSGLRAHYAGSSRVGPDLAPANFSGESELARNITSLAS